MSSPGKRVKKDFNSETETETEFKGPVRLYFNIQKEPEAEKDEHATQNRMSSFKV